MHNELPVSVSYIAGTRSAVRPSPPELLVTGGSEYLSLPLETEASGMNVCEWGGGGGWDRRKSTRSCRCGP